VDYLLSYFRTAKIVQSGFTFDQAMKIIFKITVMKKINACLFFLIISNGISAGDGNSRTVDSTDYYSIVKKKNVTDQTFFRTNGPSFLPSPISPLENQLNSPMEYIEMDSYDHYRQWFNKRTLQPQNINNSPPSAIPEQFVPAKYLRK